MVTIGRNTWRALAALLVAMICMGLDANDAYAQSSSCSRLQATLRQFDRNADFQNMQNNSGNARGLQQQVQDAESSYVRNGCNADAKAGRTLTRQCQQMGRDVLRLREQYANINQSVETANAVAQQREGILQELARFGCGADQQGGSSATFTTDRQSVFDRIFGSTTEGDFSDGQMMTDEGYWGTGGYSTVRTVCVRMTDGYFWPISYSTLQEYLPNDAAMCHAQCPNAPVDLYFYNNPGEDTEQMRNMAGQAYTALPQAFAYRQAIDTTSTCKTPTAGGSITSVATPDGDTGSIVDVGSANFRLPMRDPRRPMPVETVTPAEVPTPAAVVAMLDIPLPRPRPPGPGEAPAVKPVVQNADSEMRLVQFGDKVVRVVGPDTPYAQPAGAGT